MIRSTSAVAACAPLTPAPRVRAPLRESHVGTCFRPSTLETVYLSWLAWPRKWRSCLTDLKWDVKEPLRTTSFLGSDHPQCPYRSISGTAMEISVYTFLRYPWSGDEISKAKQIVKMFRIINFHSNMLTSWLVILIPSCSGWWPEVAFSTTHSSVYSRRQIHQRPYIRYRVFGYTKSKWIVASLIRLSLLAVWAGAWGLKWCCR